LSRIKQNLVGHRAELFSFFITIIWSQSRIKQNTAEFEQNTAEFEQNTAEYGRKNSRKAEFKNFRRVNIEYSSKNTNFSYAVDNIVYIIFYYLYQ